MATAGRKRGQNAKYRLAVKLVEEDLKVKKLATKEFYNAFKNIVDEMNNSTNPNLKFGATKIVMEVAKQYLKEQGKKLNPKNFIEPNYDEMEKEKAAGISPLFSTEYTGTDD